MINIERFRLVMHSIWADQRGYKQCAWHYLPNKYDGASGRFFFEHVSPRHICNTAHCVGGWSQIHSGEKGDASRVARRWLNLTADEAHWLFSYERTLPELKQVLKTGVIPL